MAARPYDPATDGPVVGEVQTLIRGYNGKDDAKMTGYNAIDEVSPRCEGYKTAAGRASQKWDKTWLNGQENPMQDKQLSYWGNEFERLSKAGISVRPGATGKAGSRSTTWRQARYGGRNIWISKAKCRMGHEDSAGHAGGMAQEIRELVGPEAAKHSTQSFMPQPTQEFGGGWNRQASDGELRYAHVPPLFPNVPSVADVQNKLGVTVPATYYTLGKFVGGADETQDT